MKRAVNCAKWKASFSRWAQPKLNYYVDLRVRESAKMARELHSNRTRCQCGQLLMYKKGNQTALFIPFLSHFSLSALLCFCSGRLVRAPKSTIPDTGVLFSSKHFDSLKPSTHPIHFICIIFPHFIPCSQEAFMSPSCLFPCLLSPMVPHIMWLDISSNVR